MGTRLGGALRGCGLGLLAGGLWFLVEAVGNRAAGGVVATRTLGMIAALDVGLAAAAGLVLGAIFPRGGVLLGLAMGAAYGFMRVYEPPGMGAEAVFVVVAAAALAVGGWIARRDAERSGGSVLAFVHTALLGAAAVLAVDFTLDAVHASALRGLRLPVLIALLPLLALLADSLIGLVVRRRGVRLGLEAAAAVIALAVLGKPLSTAPLENRVVTAVPPPKETPDIFLVSLDTTRADHLSLYGHDRPTSPNLEAFAADALTFTQARSTAGWSLPGHA